MIKTTLEEIITNKPAYAEVFSKVYPSNTSFKFMLLVDEMNKYINFFEKTKQLLDERYFEWAPIESASEERKRVLKEGMKEEFDIEFNKLLKQEVEFDFEKIDVGELGEKHDLTPLHMLSLKKFLKV